MSANTHMDFPEVTGCPCGFEAPPREGCCTGLNERALRAYVADWPMPPMTEAQRAWCMDEIERVEGYERPPLDTPDRALASKVILAWLDFVRDKWGAA